MKTFQAYISLATCDEAGKASKRNSVETPAGKPFFASTITEAWRHAFQCGERILAVIEDGYAIHSIRLMECKP